MATSTVTNAKPGQDDVLSLDTCHVTNWQDGPAAIMNPHASLHTQLAWCRGQVGEMHDLLWGYINIPSRADVGHEMAEQLCHFMEGRMTPLVRLLDRLCEQTAAAERAAQVGNLRGATQGRERSNALEG